MFNDPKRSTPARLQVVNLLQQIRAGEAVAGVHEVRATGRDDLIGTVTAIDPAEADVSIVIDDLTGATLGQCAEAICDLVVETNVPLVFRHHGAALQLSKVEHWPPQG
jgi:ribosome-binding ATPase YchF (GTP1/OBG family)